MDLAARTIQLGYAREKNIIGTGITVAIADTGICAHPDFFRYSNRTIYFKDFLHQRPKFYDDCGHGSHVAGIIGGSGVASDGRYCGVAPGCNILACKTLNYKGDGNISDVLVALDWILDNKTKYGIRIVNLSFGMGNKDISKDGFKLIDAVEEVWDSGIVVVAAAGNSGPEPGSVAVPGCSKKIITVGASDDHIEVELMGRKTKNYSGRGPTYECIRKPDIIAPGGNIMSCALAKSYGNDVVYSAIANRWGPLPRVVRDTYHHLYTEKSGTSMATPIVSGAIALLLSMHPDMTPKDVKKKLKQSATDLKRDPLEQGWGLLNVKKLLE
ncbi:MAG: S8 family peptidase [Clostridiales bacterium]|nr:S8 family peptidase [Clostridiales bacterium]